MTQKLESPAFPEPVQTTVSFARYLAQIGETHDQTKPLKGCHGASVLEVVEDHHGTDNVFADLNFPDPETHPLKARFIARMTTIIRDKNLTQTQAARLLGLSQPDVSRLLKGQFRDLSLERILRLLTRVCEVEILVKSPGSAGAPTAEKV